MGDWNAKHLMAAAIALVIGLAIGGVGPQGELRGLRQQLAEQGRRRCDTDVGKKIFGEVFRPKAAAQPTPADPVDEPAATPAPTEDPDPDPEVDAPATEPPVDPDPPPAQKDRLQEMKDALDLRRTQAQAALREQAGATDEQMADVDRIVADMNADLESLATEFVQATGDAQPSRHDLMIFASDTLAVLVGTEDSLGGVLDPEQLDGLGEDALDPTAYVDGSLVDVLAQLDHGPRRGR